MLMNQLAQRPIGGPAPAPMAQPAPMAPQQPMPQPPKNALLQGIGSAIDGFQRGFDPAGYKAGKDEAKAAEGDKLKKTLALMQQQRALPEAQRGQWWQQNAQVISQIMGQDVSQMPADAAQFSDQTLDGHIAALSAQAGISPDKPEPYTLTSGAERRGANNEVLASNPIDRAPVEQKAPEVNSFGQSWNGKQWVTVPGALENYGRMHPDKPDGGGQRQAPSGYDWKPDGTLSPITGGPADPLKSGVDINPKIIALETQQSNTWMPIQKNFQDIRSQYKRIETLSKRKDSAGDLGLVVSFTKMLDPGSVARESEVEMTQSAAGALQQAAMWGPRLADGKTLLPDGVRKMFLSAANDMYGVYEGAYHGLARDMQTRATQYGLSPDRIMLGYEAPAPVSDKVVKSPAMQMGIRAYSKQTGIPGEAITEFLANPSTPQEIAEFNDAFGAGQAEAILKAMRSGR